jgi:hypothetical protein
MDTEPTRPVEPPTERLSEPETEQIPRPPEPQTREIPAEPSGPPRRKPLAEAGAALAEVGRIIGNYAVYSVKAALSWAGAWRRLARLRREIKAEQRRRTDLLTLLGDAAFREDAVWVAALRERIIELDNRVGQLERERGQTVADTRARIESGRAARSGPAQAVAVDEPDG